MKRTPTAVLLALVCASCAGAVTIGNTRVEGTRWIHVDAGLVVPIPAGWSVRTINGRQVLVRAAVNGFRDNVTVLILAHDGSAIDTQVGKTMRALAQLAGVTLDHLALTTHSGRRVLALELHGRLPNQQHEVHVRSLTYVRGTKLIVVSATVLQSRWKAMQAAVAALLDGVMIHGVFCSA